MVKVRVPDQRLRSAQDGTVLVVPRSRTLRYGERRFSVIGAKVWNNLPRNMRDIRDFTLFLSQLKTFLYRRHYGEY